VNSLLSLIHEPSWQSELRRRVDIAVIEQLTLFLNAELASGKTIYPPQESWFKAINELSLLDIKVVILGQDPYHGAGQAQGLSFSVPQHSKLPPSLRNIFKEQESDLNIINESGDLNCWLQQGVLLLNAVLTVEAGQAGSHANRGWEHITDNLISLINDHRDQVVFLLWGNYADKKRALIDSEKHLILTAAHPSPLSAYRGWFGCQHFSKTNLFLEQNGQEPINWKTASSHQISLL